MSGLERIVSEILSAARAEADDLLAQARAEAQQILSDCEKDRAQATALSQQKALDKASAIDAAAQAEIGLRQRRGILETKQALLADVLRQALETLYQLPEADYFALLIKIAASNAEKGEGALFLSKDDLARVPGDFGARLAASLPAKTRLTLSAESMEIDGGCVLRYGDVDKNCSLKAIFDARREEFTDKARAILFA